MNETEPLPPGEDPTFEAAIASILRGGLFASVALLLVGLAVSATGGLSAIDVTGIPDLRATSSVASWGAALVFAGLLVLVLTPVVRVGYATRLFHRRGDRAFTTITLFVLGVLLITFLAGALH